ncbi:zinc finger protein 160-like [Oppia nitens]|uniref:zinc finger protein 160-like n=1 Tax=Oppia nitens TaxID=1686743 RepID=UPI0023DC2A45|nr:zinc finger protein 160-like [Oppia nitens]
MNTRNTRRTSGVATTRRKTRTAVQSNQQSTAATPVVSTGRATRQSTPRVTRGKKVTEFVVQEVVTEEAPEQQYEPQIDEQLLDEEVQEDEQQQQDCNTIATLQTQLQQQEVLEEVVEEVQQQEEPQQYTTIIQIYTDGDHNYETGSHEIIQQAIEAGILTEGVQVIGEPIIGEATTLPEMDDLTSYWTIEKSQIGDGRVDYVCKWMLCSFRTTSECSMRKHAIKHQKPYQCSFIGCGDRFVDTEELLQHFSVTHMDTNAFKCTFADCEERFKDIKSLTDHRVQHVSHTTQLIKANKDYKIGGQRKSQNETIAKQLLGLNNENLETTLERGEILVYGGSSNGQPSAIYDRYRSNVRTSSVIRCPIGSLTDDIVEGNDNYVKCRSNDGKFWYKCLWDYCDYGNVNEGIIRRHVLKHEFPHKCSFDGCSKSFATLSEMAEHRSTIHTGPTPYRCDWPDCSDAFEALKLLTEHKTKHLMSVSVPSKSAANREKKLKPPPTPKPFVCDFGKCNMHYTTQEELNGHKQIHSGDRPFKCQYPDCTFAAKSKDKLQIHHSRHSNIKQFRCLWPTCDKSFTISEQLRRHRKLHTNREQFICEFTGCDIEFTNADELDKHLRQHMGLGDTDFTTFTPFGFKCNFGLCKMHFQTQEELQRHSRSHCGERLFKCGYEKCSYSAKTLDKLTAHLRYHSGERPFKCDFIGCHLDFIQSHHLARHRKSHFGGVGQQMSIKDDEKQLDCDFCGQEFPDDQTLESHDCPEKSLQERLESCEIVDNSNDRKRSLRSVEEEDGDQLNEETITDDNQVINEEQSNTINEPKKRKITRRKATQINDESVDNNSKVVNCTFGKCHFKCTTEDELNEHTEKLHSGDRPFVCNFSDCTFKTNRKDKLTIHTRRHTGDRPYKCEWNGCERTFISKDNLNRHNLTHFRSKSKTESIDMEFNRTLRELDALLQDADDIAQSSEDI